MNAHNDDALTSPTTNGHAVLTAEPCTDTPIAALVADSHRRVEQQVAIIGNHITTVQHEPAALPAPALPAPPLPLRAGTNHGRNGKIARLPKLERDMVNKMLFNHRPYSKIVAALEFHDITVTERNVSNWKTRGGYKEWCLEQERQLNLSRIQDNLVDYLRKNDASQLPEVGLQVASTQLSMMLLREDAAKELAASPGNYKEVVNMLCQLSDQIHKLQKDRDIAINRSAVHNTVECIKREQAEDVEITRKLYTSPKPGRSAKEEDVPHRNELPPRERVPYREPDRKPLSPEMEREFTKKLFESLAPRQPVLPKADTDARSGREAN
ncbi:MAG TPA: hypothetical protein VLT36_14870 [Candidatus Dormibacteraeota bacterium]|nr:hypothetical protein [Candidatus Dormibacteraeota bacterium]